MLGSGAAAALTEMPSRFQSRLLMGSFNPLNARTVVPSRDVHRGNREGKGRVEAWQVPGRRGLIASECGAESAKCGAESAKLDGERVAAEPSFVQHRKARHYYSLCHQCVL